MPFKYISYLELWWPFCSAERNHLCNFGIGNPEKQFCEFILNKELWYRRCCLKDFYLELLQPSCSVKGNHLCNFCKGHYEEQFCEITFNLGQWFWRCHLKIFLIMSSGSPVWWNRTICAILVEDNRNNSAKLF